MRQSGLCAAVRHSTAGLRRGSDRWMADRERRFDHLVVDSGPLILNSLAPAIAECLYTVPEVVAEIRDAATRDRLARASPTLTVRNPSAEALQRVRAFAKATGDLASLSVADLRVIALTLTLEMEKNGPASRAITDPLERVVHSGRPREERQKGRTAGGGEGEWVTPENFDAMKARGFDSLAPPAADEERADPGAGPAAVRVGCTSTDFAVQNVLLQMCIPVLTPEGYRVRQVKNWLLRCYGCYRTTKNMERRFCEHCGNSTLNRTSYTVDAQGQLHLFLKKNFQHNNQGTIAALPHPRPGRDGNRILLREDQKEYIQSMQRYASAQRRAERLDADSLDDRLATVFGTMQIKGAADAVYGAALPAIGFGRRNPNRPRRRA